MVDFRENPSYTPISGNHMEKKTFGDPTWLAMEVLYGFGSATVVCKTLMPQSLGTPKKLRMV